MGEVAIVARRDGVVGGIRCLRDGQPSTAVAELTKTVEHQAEFAYEYRLHAEVAGKPGSLELRNPTDDRGVYPDYTTGCVVKFIAEPNQGAVEFTERLTGVMKAFQTLASWRSTLPESHGDPRAVLVSPTLLSHYLRHRADTVIKQPGNLYAARRDGRRGGLSVRPNTYPRPPCVKVESGRPSAPRTTT